MRNLELRNFLLVADVRENRLELVFQAPREHRTNIAAIDRALLAQHSRLAHKYRRPHYDIITARAESLAMVRKTFPQFRGWHRVSVQEIPLSDETGFSRGI